MSRHAAALKVYINGITRSRQLCDLYAYSKLHYPKVLDSSDMLRSAIVMAMSAFDLLLHDVYLNEVSHRRSKKLSIRGLLVPFECVITDDTHSFNALQKHVRAAHSYRSFISPDKIAEVLCHFFEEPWSKISAQIGEESKTIKNRLREIVRWRNRIAHESDINPTLGGVDLWPILEADVRTSIDFVERVGEGIVLTVEKSAAVAE